MTHTAFAIDTNNDLFINASGNMALVSDVAAVAQNCKTISQTLLGELIYNQSGGVPYKQYMWDDFKPTAFSAAMRQVILSVDGVVGIEMFNLILTDGAFSYTAVISTIYGSASING